MLKWNFFSIVFFIILSEVIYGQEYEGLPPYQLGFTLSYNSPVGMVKDYIDHGTVGVGLNFNMRIKKDKPLLVGFEYSFYSYDNASFSNDQLSSVNYDVDVSPRVNDFMVLGKYEILSGYYVIPFIEGGLGMRYFKTRITDINPETGQEISNFVEDRAFALLGKVGAGLGVSLIPPLIIELSVNYYRSSAFTYDYLAEEPMGVQPFPLDFYSLTKSAQEYFTYELSFIIEFYE